MTAGSLTGAPGSGPDDQPNRQPDRQPDEQPDDQPPPAPTGAPTAHPPRPRARRRRRPVRRTLIVTHRWVSPILGLVLVVITTSGAILVYLPEIQRWLNADAYASSGGPATVSLGQAYATVTAAHPDFEPTTVIAENGVLRVTDFERSFTVDPATGALLGEVAPDPTGWPGPPTCTNAC